MVAKEPPDAGQIEEGDLVPFLAVAHQKQFIGLCQLLQGLGHPGVQGAGMVQQIGVFKVAFLPVQFQAGRPFQPGVQVGGHPLKLLAHDAGHLGFGHMGQALPVPDDVVGLGHLLHRVPQGAVQVKADGVDHARATRKASSGSSAK